jgi:chromosome segregation ATPase
MVAKISSTLRRRASTQESLHTTQNSLSDCFNEVAVVRSDLERNVADTEARLKNDIRQKQQEAFEKIGAVEQQCELRSAEASRRLGALDLRMSGVQGGLGEHKRDILKLREEVNGLTVKSTSNTKLPNFVFEVLFSYLPFLKSYPENLND